MNVSIRPLKGDDLLEVRHVIWNTWLATYGPFIPEEDLHGFFDENYSVEALEQQMANSNVACFIAEVDGEIAGFERTYFNTEEKREYVASLYILPERHGLGLGTQLMLKAAQEAKRRSQDNVWLGVMTQNQQAVDWYKKIGFHVHEEKPFTMGKTTVPHFIGYVPVSSIEKAAKARSKKKK